MRVPEWNTACDLLVISEPLNANRHIPYIEMREGLSILSQKQATRKARTSKYSCAPWRIIIRKIMNSDEISSGFVESLVYTYLRVYLTGYSRKLQTKNTKSYYSFFKLILRCKAGVPCGYNKISSKNAKVPLAQD